MLKQQMGSKMEEITETKKQREELFADFDVNKDQIADLYWEVQIKELQYLFLKRQQLVEIKAISLIPDSVENINKINDTCITLLQNQLIAEGYEERLIREGLV